MPARRRAGLGAAVVVLAAAVVWLVSDGDRSYEFRLPAGNKIDGRVPTSVRVSIRDEHTVRLSFGSGQRLRPGSKMDRVDSMTYVGVSGTCARYPQRTDGRVSFTRKWGVNATSPGGRPIDVIEEDGRDPIERRPASTTKGAYVDLELARQLPKTVCVVVGSLVGGGKDLADDLGEQQF